MMESLYLLIPLSLLLIFLAIALFLRASTGGQFDDLQKPAEQILLDDDRIPTEETTANLAELTTYHLHKRHDTQNDGARSDTDQTINDQAKQRSL